MQLCIVMILGSVENKWTLSNLWFIKIFKKIVFTHMLTWLEGCMVKSFRQRRPFHSSWQYVSGLYIKWDMGWQIYPLWLFDRLLNMALDLWCELLLICLPSLYYSVIFGMRIWVMIFICVPFYPFGLKSKTYTWFLSRGDFVCHSWNEVHTNVVAIFFNVSIMWIFLCWKYM